MFPDLKELPYLIAAAGVGVVLCAYEAIRLAVWVVHHVQIVW
jgi:hypothetical protein